MKEKEIYCQTKAGGDHLKKKKASQFALHLQTPFRFLCGDVIVLGNSDIYQPAIEDTKDPNFDWENYNCDEIGQNHFDEVIAGKMGKNLSQFVVKGISCSCMGDIKIAFENKFILEVMVDSRFAASPSGDAPAFAGTVR